MNPREAIRSLALSLGFDLCRFTSAAPPASFPRFQSWIDAGHHGTMAYLARNSEKRADPAKILPQARSIVTLATSYSHPIPTPPPTESPGIVARYAHFSDYHLVLQPALTQLTHAIDALQTSPIQTSLFYTDTGPILERDLAQRAGIGFVGKHTNLVSRSLGNWFLLAEILTPVEFEPDLPETNRCGSCHRCLDACPTEALPAPFTLTATRCIAYLTIELKERIPEPLRPLIGNRIFGCDDCLAACPWNRFAREATLLAPHHRPDLHAPALQDWLQLDDQAFKQRFQNTPMLRSKRRGLLRNVCVALGNTGNPDDLPALHRAASDPEPMIREHATWAIEQIKNHQHHQSTAGSNPPPSQD